MIRKVVLQFNFFLLSFFPLAGIAGSLQLSTQPGFTHISEATNRKVNGLKQGKWVEYLDAGFKETEVKSKAGYYRLVQYEAGKICGTRLIFYISGELFGEASYKMGERTGMLKNYYKNGQQKVVTSYVNGKANGPNTEYYENGKILRTSSFQNDKQEGLTRKYFNTGELQWIRPYSYGLTHGIEKTYDEKGQLVQVQCWLYGVPYVLDIWGLSKAEPSGPKEKLITGLSYPIQGMVVPAGQPKETIIPAPRITKTKFKTIVSLQESPFQAIRFVKTISPGKENYSFPETLSVIPRHVKCIYPVPVAINAPKLSEQSNSKIVNYGTRENLPDNIVDDIELNSRHWMWIATRGGISRFDGQRFTTFGIKEGLPSNHVRCVLEAKDGKIWIGTEKGLCVFDGQQFDIYDKAQGFTNSEAWTMMQDSKGNIWIGTMDDGLYEYSKGRFIKFTDKQGLGDDVRAFMEDKNGNVWIGTQQGGLYKYNGTFFLQVDLGQGNFGKVSIHSITMGHDGDIWIGTVGNGLFHIRDTNYQHYSEKEGLPSNSVLELFMDSKNRLWVGSWGKGVSVLEAKELRTYNVKNGLSDDIISAIKEDSNGDMIIGTMSGFSKIYMNSFEFLTKNGGLSDNLLLHVIPDTVGRLWFSTFFGGVDIYNGYTIAAYGDTLNGYSCILKDRKGFFWLTGGSSLSRFDGVHLKTYTVSEGLCGKYVTTAKEDKYGNIWIGTNGGGLSVFNGSTFTNYSEKEGFTNGYVTCFEEDKMGRMWVGTMSEGAWCFEKNTITHYTKKEGLFKNYITCIHQDKTGTLWLGSDPGGIQYFDGLHFYGVSEKEGVSGGSVLNIMEDSTGNFWLVTYKGLDFFDKKKFMMLLSSRKINGSASENPVLFASDSLITVFDQSDGLIDEGSTGCGSAYMDKKGQGWWGSGKGIISANFSKGLIHPVAPELEMDYLEVNESTVSWNNLKELEENPDSSIAKKLRPVFSHSADFGNYPIGLELPYNSNHITFHCSAIDWQAPHRIVYQFMLEGLDRQWSRPTPDNKFDYREIPPGQYVFKARAIGIAGKWSSPFLYSFVIRPPWWKTWWAYTCYILAGALLLYTSFRWRERQLLQRQKELENTVEERTMEVTAQKEVLSHQKELIEEKQKEILDSINYAKRIQYALLAEEALLKVNLPEHFVLFKPKDIVSGDFYWAFSKGGRFLLAACDSTGHGVPGAFMSLLNISFLNEALVERNLTNPNEIFNHVRSQLIKHISQDGGQDGMDGVIVSLEQEQFSYAAAHNAPVVVRGKSVLDLDADKMPVGKSPREETSFSLRTVPVQKGDMLYLFTDGYADQFGGPKGKKFKYKQLMELFVSISELPVNEQQEKLQTAFEAWKGDNEQVDDVLVIGVRIV